MTHAANCFLQGHRESLILEDTGNQEYSMGAYVLDDGSACTFHSNVRQMGRSSQGNRVIAGRAPRLSFRASVASTGRCSPSFLPGRSGASSWLPRGNNSPSRPRLFRGKHGAGLVCFSVLHNMSCRKLDYYTPPLALNGYPLVLAISVNSFALRFIISNENGGLLVRKPRDRC